MIECRTDIFLAETLEGTSFGKFVWEWCLHLYCLPIHHKWHLYENEFISVKIWLFAK